MAAAAVSAVMERAWLQASWSLSWVAMGLVMGELVLLLHGTEVSGNCRPIHCFDTTPRR